MTLLQGVGVLAIDDVSVMSEATTSDPSASETANANRRGRRDRLVTLKVKPIQARALQLADEFGDVSLALRNPMDIAPVETDSTMLSDLADEYTRLLAAIAPLRVNEPLAEHQSPPSSPTPFALDTRAEGTGQDSTASTVPGREPCAEDRAQRPARLLIGEKPVEQKSEIMVISGEKMDNYVFRPNGSWWVLDSRTHSGTKR